MTKFVAYAVDLSGTALARYDLAAADAEAAERETRQYLEEHPWIEVWGSDHRVVSQFEISNSAHGLKYLNGSTRIQ
jgi:hypothetical protein